MNNDDLERLQMQYEQGSIGRRRFLQQVAAIGGIGALHAMGVPGVIPSTRAAGPSSGGNIRIGVGSGSTTDSLDPATINSTFMQIVNYGLRNNLTEVAPNGELVPELCESWEATPDARVWTFKLRRDVEFHNGKTMDAGDVIASINHHRGEESESSAKSILEPVEAVRADGKDTVVVELQQGNADFPFLLSDYHITIMPVTSDGLDVASGVGTGGYMLKQFKPGTRCSMERNPNYWKENAGWFNSAEVLAIKDSTSRTNALATGEIDVMNRVQLSTASRIDGRSGMRIEETSGNQHVTMPMHTDKDPFSDNHVRLALKHAVDREELLEKVLNGHGYLGNDHPLGRANPFLAENIEQRTYDPDKARHHLKKAGLDSLKVRLSTSDAAFQGAVDAAALFQQHAKKAGIDIDVKRESSDGYWSEVWLKDPFCVGYWGGRPTADWMFSAGYAADAAWNATNWKNDRFNQLMKSARAELDRAKRQEMYTEMQQILHEDGGVIVPVFLNYVMALRDNVQHDKMAANWDLDGLKCIERWWMA
jgi:peptide/nickel transport system substrate-binding protein